MSNNNFPSNSNLDDKLHGLPFRENYKIHGETPAVFSEQNKNQCKCQNIKKYM